ncbi:MAG: NAD(P)-dependent oxidoreductase [Gammaproteobacteria bacterium]|nr:NAD(P)-dependent oxidoreductase [Gammaproteobacteria bacterium]
MAKLGFIGIGLMGLPMCKRLLAADHELWVWNRNADKCAPLMALGARAVHSIADLAQQVDVIMLCVSDTPAVQMVAQQLLPHLRAGQVIVDFSSISPDATKELFIESAKLKVSWVDCPVSGGVAGAEAGTLAMMAGGEEKVVHSLEPVLLNLGQRVTYMGESGSGQTTKIANQMIVSCNVLVLAEVMAMAKRAGVDTAKIPQALQGGFADSTPLQLTGSRMAVQDFAEVKWHVKTLLKDLDMANVLAKDVGSAIPMAGLGAELMRQHASKGFAEKDPATFVAMYEAITSNQD